MAKVERNGKGDSTPSKKVVGVIKGEKKHTVEELPRRGALGVSIPKSTTPFKKKIVASQKLPNETTAKKAARAFRAK